MNVIDCRTRMKTIGHGRILQDQSRYSSPAVFLLVTLQCKLLTHQPRLLKESCLAAHIPYANSVTQWICNLTLLVIRKDRLAPSIPRITEKQTLCCSLNF